VLQGLNGNVNHNFMQVKSEIKSSIGFTKNGMAFAANKYLLSFFEILPD